MKRTRVNRRKAAPRQLPKLPAIRLGINWRALTIPPLAVALAIAGAQMAREALDRPIRSLVVEGTFQRVTPIQIEAALDPGLGQTFFDVDLDALKDAVAALDWVDKVELRRQWPGALRVSVTEHQAAASWGEHGLLNTRGELFTEDARYVYPELPKLSGPPGSERRVAAIYLAARGRLADANLRLESVSMDARGALDLRLAGGQEIRFGRNELEVRLDRFFDVAARALAPQFARVRYVDLRYPNGFAVGWHDEPPPARPALAENDDRG